MAQWESKREQKKQERDARVLAAHRAHPDLADADARLSKHALDCVKRSLHGDVTGLDDADVTYQALREERRALLERYGLTRNGKRAKAGYHYVGGALPFILSICQKSHPVNLLFLRSLL